MSDEIFTNLTFKAREAEGPLRIEAAVEMAKPDNDGEGVVPCVFIHYDAPPPTGGGFTNLSIAQARRLADLLTKCADHAQRALDEAKRRGWELIE